MPSDPHSFDELKLPFIFVPYGAPEPTEKLRGYADWIKLPATLEPDRQSAQQGERPVGAAGRPGGRGSAGGQSASPNPGMPQPPAAEAMSDAPSAAPGTAPIPDDPIAAYRRANDALTTTANGHPRGHNAPPAAPPASAMDDDTTNPDRRV